MHVIARTTGSWAGKTGGRRCARQLLVVAAAIACASVPLPAARTTDPSVTVREERGTYTVSAEFGVPQPAPIAVDVLTDYEQIPRFMPAVNTSKVLERIDGSTIVEQHAVARLMMFSRQVHLVLEVREEPNVIRFRDRSGASFTRYDGSWTITEQNGQTTIGYQLTARPSFAVPEFILKRLLRRDSTAMIERLQSEIAGRARAPRRH